MEHIGPIVKVKNTTGNTYGPDALRERLPVLKDVPDSEITANWQDLWDAAKCKRLCSGCHDFATCKLDGDGKGRVVKVSVTDSRLIIEKLFCNPRLEHEARQRQARLIEASGMTEKDKQYIFANYPPDQRRKHRRIYEFAHDFAENFEIGEEKKGLYLFGTPGIGKTHLMQAVINRLNDRGIPAVFVRTDKITSQLHKALDDNTVDEVVRRYASAPVLGIDEFGQEPFREFTIGRLIDIVNARSHAKLPTFFTSNFMLIDAYKRHYGTHAEQIDALRSRVAALAVPALMEGEDHRMNFDEMLGPEVDA